MTSSIEILESLLENLKEYDNLNKINLYYKNKFYIVVLIKQINNLVINLKSISALLEIKNIQDAYTIFRKYLETYFIIMSIFENPDVVDSYMEHDKMIGEKACRKNINEIIKLCKTKPSGYLEYGYLESKIKYDVNFKYTMYTVCEQAKLLDFHKWYKQSNNFVHNNLSMVSVDEKIGESKLIEHINESIKYFVNKFNIFV